MTGSKAFNKRKISWKECTERIYYKRACDLKGLEEFINLLGNFLKEQNRVLIHRFLYINLIYFYLIL